jgi:glycosyltransferase involved in cell wall biosynthesis
MVAYACDPQGAGEHWLGWGWAEQAASFCDVVLITTPKAREAVEAAAAPLGIQPVFVEVSSAVRRATEFSGLSWGRKLAWSRQAGKVAHKLHQERPFALAHQTTFHTFRVPFAAAGLGIPSVWGPIAGGESAPPGFGAFLGKARNGEVARRLINRLWLKVPSVRRSLNAVSCLFVSNRTTLQFLPKAVQSKCRVVAPNALRPQDRNLPVRTKDAGRNPGGLELLYVGNCVATRAIPIVMEAIQSPGLETARLRVVGGGPAIPFWQELAQHAGLTARVEFVGKVPHRELDGFYAAADALVFPALRDSGGSALLEAMARQVPVVCLDWGGPGEMIDANSGLKVPVGTPAETVHDFAVALRRLTQEPGLGPQLAAAARTRALEQFDWSSKRRLLETLYPSLIAR